MPTLEEEVQVARGSQPLANPIIINELPVN